MENDSKLRKFMASWDNGYIGNICSQNGKWWFMGDISKYNSLKELESTVKYDSIVILSELF